MNKILEEFSDITIWGRAEQRAPHKPLLILYARVVKKLIRLEISTTSILYVIPASRPDNDRAVVSMPLLYFIGTKVPCVEREHTKGFRFFRNRTMEASA